MEWLVIIQQIVALVSTWLAIIKLLKPPQVTFPRGIKPILVTALLGSVLITSLVMGIVQPSGMLQQWELEVFAQMMRLRPDESLDPRLLIVTVTPEDIEYQDRKGWDRGAKSLSDQALAEVLKKLNGYQPRVIGLDIYRDFPAKNPDAKTQLEQNNRLIATCKIKVNNTGIKPPPEIQEEKRLGFNNFPEDSDDTIRRQLLGMATPKESRCPEYSLSLRLAIAYLREKGISPIQFNEGGNLQIGKVIFPKLDFNAGGYQLPPSEAQGYQILLNYRSSQQVAEQITLKQLLDGSLNSKLPGLVNDKIVLIGTNAAEVGYEDLHLTPYNKEKKIPGVIIHAQMVSQILSAVLNGRTLLWWWPQAVENLWVWFWSLVGGIVVSCWRSQLIRLLVMVAALGILYIICFLVFVKMGGWLPIVPSTLGLLLTGVCMAIYLRIYTKFRRY